MVGQGHFCKPIKFFSRNYLPFADGGTTLNNRPVLTSMTVCIESFGTGDISSSIVCGVTSRGEATSMQAKWIEPDLCQNSHNGIH